MINEIVCYDGIKFYQTKQGYLLGNYMKKPIRLHIYQWLKNKGEIPKGYQIHHKDEDKTNNDISNLEIKTQHDHLSYHGKKEIKDLDHLAKIRPLSVEWHKSEDGREWHKQQWIKSIGKHVTEYVTKICEVCGKEYQVNVLCAYKSKYCNSNCKATALRRRRKASGESKSN